MPPAASSRPKSRTGRTGERARPRTPALTGPYRALRPRRRQHCRPTTSEPTRTLSHLLRTEPRRGPPLGPTLLPRPSLDRARPKEGGSPPRRQRPQAQLGGRRTPPHLQRGLLLLQPRLGRAPRSASAAPQRRRQLTGGSLRRAPRIKPAPKALRDAQELTGTAEGHGGLYEAAVCSDANAPLLRTVRGSDLKAIRVGNEREATRGRGAFRGLTPYPSCGARVTLLWEQRRPTCNAHPGQASPLAPYGGSVALERIAWWEL